MVAPFKNICISRCPDLLPTLHKGEPEVVRLFKRTGRRPHPGGSWQGSASQQQLSQFIALSTIGAAELFSPLLVPFNAPAVIGQEAGYVHQAISGIIAARYSRIAADSKLCCNIVETAAPRSWS